MRAKCGVDMSVEYMRARLDQVPMYVPSSSREAGSSSCGGTASSAFGGGGSPSCGGAASSSSGGLAAAAIASEGAMFGDAADDFVFLQITSQWKTLEDVGKTLEDIGQTATGGSGIRGFRELRSRLDRICDDCPWREKKKHHQQQQHQE